LYAFGILFFLVVLVPECLLIPLYLFFGYRAIIPMGGVFLVLGGAFLGLIQFLKATPRSKVFGAVTAALVVVPVIALGATTWSISRHWSPLSFWKTANDQLPPYSDQVEQIPYLQVLLNYGLELLDTGNYPEAVKVLKRAALMAPDVERALSAKQTGQSEPSAHHEKYSPLRNILTKHPGINASLLALGLATIKSGNSPEGIAFLEFLVRRDPTNQAARLALANALMQAGNTAEGIDNLKRAVAAQPGSVAARIDLGLAYKRVGNLSGAIDLFQQAVAIDPSSGIAYFNLARALEETGKLPQALERYRSAVQFMPASPEAHYCLANALLKSGNAAEAIQEFQKATQLKPDYAEAHANLGAALLGAGQPSDAVASFEKALTVIKDNAELHNALGVALAEAGQNQRAMDQFKRALALQPSHASARENLERLATAHGKRPPEPENKGPGLP
jgi:tetratricopeptide (TPR) repeat protein